VIWRSVVNGAATIGITEATELLRVFGSGSA